MSRILVSVGIIGAVGAAVYYAYLNCFAPSPRIKQSQIEESGGKFIVSPSGRLMEYFEFGSTKSEATSTLLLLHGAMTTGQLWQIHDNWGKQNKVRIIAPSIPGWGLSEHKGIDIKNQPQEFIPDVLALMKTKLNIDKFHVAGASLGSIYAAQIAASPETSPMVLNVMLYVPIAPKSDTHDPLKGSPLKATSDMHKNPALARMIERYFFIPLLKNFILPPDGKRSLHQWEGLWKCTDDIYSEWLPSWRDMAKSRKVYVVGCKTDELAPPENQKVLMEGIEGATLIVYDGHHATGIEKPEVMQDHLKVLLN